MSNETNVTTSNETPETSEERNVVIIDYTRIKRAATTAVKWTAKLAVPIAAVATAAYLAGHNDGVSDALEYEEALKELEEAERTDSDDES